MQEKFTFCGKEESGVFTKKLVELAKKVMMNMSKPKIHYSNQSLGIGPPPLHKINDNVLVSPMNSPVLKNGTITAFQVVNFVWYYDISYNDGTFEVSVQENRIYSKLYYNPTLNGSGTIPQTTYSVVPGLQSNGGSGNISTGMGFCFTPGQYGATYSVNLPKFHLNDKVYVDTTLITHCSLAPFIGRIIGSQSTGNTPYVYDIEQADGSKATNFPENCLSFYNPVEKVATIVNNDEIAKCTCSMMDLMRQGCKCGAFQKEKNMGN